MKIKNGIERELGKIKRKEDRFLREEPKKENEKLESVKGKIKEKIPPKLVDTLNKAFTKAFYLVFEKGTAVVEKTFRKEDLSLEFSVNDFRVQKSPTGERLIDLLRKVGWSMRVLPQRKVLDWGFWALVCRISLFLLAY